MFSTQTSLVNEYVMKSSSSLHIIIYFLKGFPTISFQQKKTGKHIFFLPPNAAQLPQQIAAATEARQKPIRVTSGHSTCLTCELDKDWRRETDRAWANLGGGLYYPVM